MSAACRKQRGTVLFAVLFLVVVAALSAASMLTATSAERVSVVRSLEELELRLAARSGLAIVTAEFALQRTDVLGGGSPVFPERLRIDRGEGEPAIVVEFSGRGGGGPEPEAGRLDLNRAPVEVLGALSGIPEGLADAIDRQRSRSPLRSPLEAVGLARGSAGSPRSDEAKFGDAGSGNGDDFANPFDAGTLGLTTEDLPTASDATGFGDAGDGPAGFGGDGDLGGSFAGDPIFDNAGSQEGEDANRWLEFVTVFAAEPQVAVGVANPDRCGVSLVNINAPWSDRLETAVGEALADEGSVSLQGLFVDAPRLTSLGVLVDYLNRRAVPREEWAALFDAVTMSASPFRLGLVDVNSASAPVLAALPGLDFDAAEAIVDARERVDLADRLSLLWLLDEGLVTDEQFRACIDFLCVRSLQWRFVMTVSFDDAESDEIGFDPGDAPSGLLPEADEFGVAIEDEDDGMMGPTLSYEVVIDLAGAEPRLAYLREQTAVEFAKTIARLPGFGLDPESGELAGLEDTDRIDDEFSEFTGDGSGSLGDGPAGFSEIAGFDDDPFGFGVSELDDEAGSPESQVARDGRDGAVSSSDADRGGGRGGPSGGGAGAGGQDNRIGRWAPARTSDGSGG